MNKSIFSTVLAVSLGALVVAQEPATDSLMQREMEAVTIVGERVKSIPGSGQYIGIAMLEKLNQANVNNVLRVIPGVNIRDEEGFGLRPNIGLRGTAVNRSARITLMEDGILMAPAPYADPAAYYFPTFARMRGVEVLKGSSQIKYGPYTIGGAVNLLSTPIPGTSKGFAQLTYGSFGTNQQRVWAGNSHNQVDYVFEVNRVASKGFKILDNGGNTGFDRRDIMGKIRWRSNELAAIPQSFTLKFVHASELGNETYLGLTFEDYSAHPFRRYAATQLDRLDLQHSHLSLNHTISLLPGLSVSSTAYYTTTFRDWARAYAMGGKSINSILSDPLTLVLPYQIMVGKADGEVDYQSAARTYFSKGLQSSTNFFFRTGGLVHRIQAGFRYHTDQSDRYATRSVYRMTNAKMVLSSSGVLGNQENQIREASSFAGYMNYDLQYKRLKVSPGVRFERISFRFQNFGVEDNARLGMALQSASNELAILLPGVGVTYTLSQQSQLFGGIHRGFSPPGMPSPSATKEQPKSETSLNYELGFRFETAEFRTQMVGFRNDYSNILGSDNLSGGGAGSGDLFNAGRALVQGLELSVGYDFPLTANSQQLWKLPLSIAYTFTHAVFQETFKNGGGDWGSGTIYAGDRIPFITPHTLTASAGLEHASFNATLTGRFNGQTRTKPGQALGIVPAERIPFTAVDAIASFLIIDFAANYNVNERISFLTTIHNLTNNTAIIANLPQGYRPNLPLSVNFGVRIVF